MAVNDQIVIPEIVDYEVRRELLRSRKSASIQRLDDLVNHPRTSLLPISSEALLRAAHLWAQVRQAGRPTADVQAIDIDVILAAQVLTAANLHPDITVATSNVSHISLFLPAAPWRSL